ncbi:hypothetical protein QR680_003800 [Steinernema hermaphroditum]|uniref:Galectin n=1 Tax=Steinernema hermaphroditum TaxID=289476 RepID=A0AA39HMM4_9BILA|nr:hypothetical protein QR680_003800 [Steinernema hermaphroditum]
MLLCNGRLVLLLCLLGIVGGGIVSNTTLSRIKHTPSSKKYKTTLDGKHKQMEKLSLPVIVDIDEPLAIDQTIRIEGHLPHNFKSLNITLGANHHEDDEYAPLHLNLQLNRNFNLKRIERGQLLDISQFVRYKQIEPTLFSSIKPGKRLIVHIRLFEDNGRWFHITINHLSYAFVKNTFQLDQIKQVSLDGDASIERVEWGGRSFKTPFLQTFPPLKEGRVVVTGLFNDDDWFALAFLDSRAEKPFYFNIRFKERKALANTLTNRKWGEEKFASKFTFDLHRLLEITLLVNSEEVQVLAYGELIMKYKHRTDPRKNYVGIWITGADVYSVIWT